MKISYTGRHEEFPPKQRAKLEAKIQKLTKLTKGDKEAHVILSQERFLRKVEITLNVWDHALVGVGTNRDLITASDDAVDRLEKQLVKLRTKFHDNKRHAGKDAGLSQAVEPAGVSSTGKKKSAPVHARDGQHPKKVFRVNHRDGSKPMTVDEAMLEMGASQDYMVYRDAGTDRVTVLMRRPDGHFDLIES
jgi:putative sigma-54 modulation protein